MWDCEALRCEGVGIDDVRCGGSALVEVHELKDILCQYLFTHNNAGIAEET